MSSTQAVTAVTISGAFVVGMVLALLGSIKLALARQLKLGEARVGGLLFALNLALIPMMLLTGLLIDQLGVRVVLILGAMIASAAIFSMSLSPNYRRAFFAVLFLGLGVAAVNTSVVVLMPRSFTGTERELTANINLGHVFIAMGALITPVLADVLLRTLGYRRTVMLMALGCLVPAFLCFLPAFGKELEKQEFNWSQHFWQVQSLDLLLAGLVFFFYAPLEGAISTWTTTYLIEHGYNEGRAALLLTGFWTAFMGSRLLVAFLQLKPGWDPFLIVVPALLTAVVLGNLRGTARPTGARNGMLLVGFLLGPIFPTLVGIMFRKFELDRGTVYGVMFAIGSAGSLVMAPLVGLRAGNHNAQAGLRITMFLALLLTLMAVVFALVVGSGRGG
jgi:fucose permease